MLLKTLSEITNEMFVELGRPDPKTELTLSDMEAQWNKALDEFNSLVGKWELRLLTCKAGEQRYHMEEMFPSLYVRDIVNVFYATGTSLNSIIEEYYEYYSPPAVFSYYDYDSEPGTDSPAYVPTSTDDTQNYIDAQRAAASMPERDYKFIHPDTLLLLPAPPADGVLLVIAQVNYTFATLPDQYEQIITDYAVGRCQRIIGNARVRLATPMRAGDFVKHVVRNREFHNVGMYADAVDKFKQQCDQILVSRVF